MKRILIIRFSSIGDIVLTSPVIRAIKLQVKDAEIHYLTKKQYAPLLESNTYIDKLILLDGSLNMTLKMVKQNQYDFVVDLHHNLRTFIIKKILGRPSATYPKLNIKKWIYVHLKIDRLPVMHLVDRYFMAVKSLGVYKDDLGLDYFIPNETSLDSAFPNNLPERFIAYAIGAKFATKRMPEEKISILCSELSIPVILIGGKEDNERGDWIANHSENEVINACGKLSLNQSASVIQRAAVLITHDTGMMHIGTALGKKLIVIWGNTVPAFGMYPYSISAGKNQLVMFENQDLSCRPCSKLGHQSCPKRHFFCMQLHNESEIAATSTQLLNSDIIH